MKLTITNIQYETEPGRAVPLLPDTLEVSIDIECEDMDKAITEAIELAVGYSPVDYNVPAPDAADASPDTSDASPHLLKKRKRRREIQSRRQMAQAKRQLLAHLPEGTLLKCDGEHTTDTMCVDIECHLGDENPLVRKTRELKGKTNDE